MATAIGDPLGIAYAHSGLAVVADAEQQVAHLEAGLSVLGDDPESLDLRVIMGNNRASRLGTLGSPAAEAAVDEILLLAERVGTYRTSSVRAHAAEFHLERGRWDDALLHIAQLDPAALRHPGFARLHAIRAIIAYRRGEPDEGARHLRAAGLPDTEPDEIAGPTGAYLFEAAALRAECAGDLAQALRIRSRYLDVPPGPLRDSRCSEAPQLVRMALAADDLAVAQAAAKAVAEFAGRPATDGRLAAESCRAMLDRDPARLLAAAEEYLTGGWRLFAAFVIEEAAALLAAADDTAAARARFVAATDIYRELGADWDLRRAGARFRPYGIRLGTRGQPRPARRGWASLTATELRISRLVARGLSNADIAREMMLSRNTVQTHVSNVLAKLGRRSRVELARDVILHDAKADSPAEI